MRLGTRVPGVAHDLSPWSTMTSSGPGPCVEHLGFEDAMRDYHDLLARADIDVVSVCTPPVSHAGIVLDAIRANKHVLCRSQ